MTKVEKQKSSGDDEKKVDDEAVHRFYNKVEPGTSEQEEALPSDAEETVVEVTIEETESSSGLFFISS